MAPTHACAAKQPADRVGEFACMSYDKMVPAIMSIMRTVLNEYKDAVTGLEGSELFRVNRFFAGLARECKPDLSWYDLRSPVGVLQPP